jgi:hypothetical protein
MGLDSTLEKCVVKIGNEIDESFYVTLRQDEFKFVKGWTSIGCIDKGSGLYGDCSNDLPLIRVNPKIQGLDLQSEIVIDQRNVVMNGENFNGWMKPFQVLLWDNIKKAPFWVGCALFLILLICAIMLVVYCRYFKEKSGQNQMVTITILFPSPPINGAGGTSDVFFG